jgi:hypothetical protein
MALLLLVPVVSATIAPQRSPMRSTPRQRQAVTVPEGGSALVYVLGAGITCLAAMIVRARSAKSMQA